MEGIKLNNKIEKIQRLKEEYKKRIIDTNREADKAFKKGNDILYEYLIGKNTALRMVVADLEESIKNEYTSEWP